MSKSVTEQWLDAGGALRDEIRRIDALRPSCPTCGGNRKVFDRDKEQPAPGSAMKPCPDCVDGKVSIEQLAATWRAVHGSTTFANTAHNALLEGWNEAIDHLRTVRP